MQRLSRGPIAATRIRVGTSRGANIGKVAAGRKLLTLVFYGLRDGHIRCPEHPTGVSTIWTQPGREADAGLTPTGRGAVERYSD